MGLTNNSKAYSIKKKQERNERRLEKALTRAEAKQNKNNGNGLSDEAKEALSAARERIDIARELFEETGELEHSRYLQKCMSDYDNLQRRLK